MYSGKKSIIPLLMIVCSLFCCGHIAQANGGMGDLVKIKNNFKKVYITGSPLTDELQRELEANPPGFGASDRVVMELQQRVPFSKAFVEELCRQDTLGMGTSSASRKNSRVGESLSG